VITNEYHVPSLSANLFYLPLLTKTDKKIKLWDNRFVVKDINNDFGAIVEGVLDPKYMIYKLRDSKKDHGPITLIDNTNYYSII
jgi:hypothetical protein